jgi:hypothetical protein
MELGVIPSMRTNSPPMRASVPMPTSPMSRQPVTGISRASGLLETSAASSAVGAKATTPSCAGPVVSFRRGPSF